jgi:hypothetical protein
VQGFHDLARGNAEAQAQLVGQLRSATELGERALVGAGKIDAVSECQADALRGDAGRRAAAGRAALERMEGFAANGAALGRVIEGGRERVLGALALGEGAVRRQEELGAACAWRLDECAALVGEAAEEAERERDGVRSRWLEAESALAAAAQGIEEARGGVEGALADNGEVAGSVQRSVLHLVVRRTALHSRGVHRT